MVSRACTSGRSRRPRYRGARQTARGPTVRARRLRPAVPARRSSGRRRARWERRPRGVWARVFRYSSVALLDVAGDDGHVAVVYDREVIEDSDILRRVVRPEEVRDAANALRTEARPDAEGRRRIKGSSDYRSVAILKILGVWQSHESPHSAETWCLERVGRFVAPNKHLPYCAGERSRFPPI